MRYFGSAWDAPVCDEGLHVPTPVGEACGACGETILAGARGLLLVAYLDGMPRDWPVHLDCLLGSIGR